MNRVELPGIAAIAAKTADYGTIVPFQHPDFVVLAVDDVQIGLLRVACQIAMSHTAPLARVLVPIEIFGDERAVFLEHLDAVVQAIARVEQPVARRAPRSARDWRTAAGPAHWAQGSACRRSADRRMHPSAACTRRCRVEHDDAAIVVAVGDIDLVGVVVDRRVAGLPSVVDLAAPGVGAILPICSMNLP